MNPIAERIKKRRLEEIERKLIEDLKKRHIGYIALKIYNDRY